MASGTPLSCDATTDRTRKGSERTKAIVSYYLKDLRAASPLCRERELEHATALKLARETYAALLLELPEAVRQTVLGADQGGPRRGSRWPLGRLEDSYLRLVAINDADLDPRSRARVRELQRQKRRVDAARDALIVSNLRFVPHVAKNFVRPGVSFLDLVQEGNLGLMMAVDRFEPERGYRFPTYAYWWIRKSISRALIDKGRTIRLPEHAARRIRELKQAALELGGSLGREPTSAELAQRMSTSSARVAELFDVMNDTHPIETSTTANEAFDALRYVPDCSTPSPLESTLDRELKERIAEALAILTPRERQVLQLRYGMDGGRAHTLKSIGKLLNVSREWVRQIERRALKKIETQRLLEPGDRLGGGH